MTHHRWHPWILALLAAGLMVGCAAQPGHPAPPAPSTSPVSAADAEPSATFDACAGRMHDLAGLLLLQYMRDGELPLRLDQLGPGLAGMPRPPLTCPVSGRPYVYNPVGIYLPERRAHLVLYDAAPSHGGYRWCIIAEEGEADMPPVFKVIALPESFFVLRPPESSGS